MTTMPYNQPGARQDFRDYLRLLRRRGWILALCLVLIPVAAYQYTKTRPAVYEASTLLEVQATGGVEGVTNPDFAQPQTNIEAIAQFVSTSAVAQEAAERLGMRSTALLGKVTAIADTDTGFVTITATGGTPREASRTANAFAAALNTTRGERGEQRVGAAIEEVRENLAATPRDNVTRRTELSTQLQRLETLRRAQAQNVQVLQPATGATQVAPHPRRNATVALLLAFLVGIALILLVERFDRRLRRPEDVERVTGLPFLATIPREAFEGPEAHPEVPEAFQTLRNTLTYFNADEQIRTLLVTSSLQGEGKTTVAANLATAYAAAGKRVVVVDTDLRKPDLAKRLGFSDGSGLSDVLSGTRRIEDALIDVPPYGGGMRLLPAGPIPPNPSALASALVGSLRMASLVEELAQDADIVIFDSTPLLMVSDAFPLLDKVSGVVLLARIDKTPHDALTRSSEILTSTGAPALGVVVTGEKMTGLTGYGYGYGYGYGRAAKPTPKPAHVTSASAEQETAPEPASERDFEPGPDPERSVLNRPTDPAESSLFARSLGRLGRGPRNSRRE